MYINKSTSLSEYVSEHKRKDFSYMTCLIHAKNNNKVVIASDSCNHITKTSFDGPTIVQKICINKQYPLIIASAGENASIYNDGTAVRVLDIMNDFVKEYNGYNYSICLDKLRENSIKFISDMELEGFDRVLQFFVAYYDFEAQDICSHAYEIVKDGEGVHAYIKDSVMNMNFTSFGRYANFINQKYRNYKAENDEELNKEVTKNLYQYIKMESVLPTEDRYISGPIQWAEITKDGKLYNWKDGKLYNWIDNME